MCKVDQQQVVIAKPEVPVEVKTLSLAVSGDATSLGGHASAATFDGTGSTSVKVTATTNDGPVTWAVTPSTAKFTENGLVLTVALNEADNVLAEGSVITIKATTASVADTPAETLVVRPVIDKLEVQAGNYATETSAGNWYAPNLGGLVPTAAAKLKVSTKPVSANALSHLEWKAEDTSNSNAPYTLSATTDAAQKTFLLNTTGKIKTSVRLKSDADWSTAKSQTIDVQALPSGSTLANSLGVKLKQFTYAGTGYFGVTREDAGNFNNLYSADWTDGTPDLPQGCAANKAIAANTVKLAVTAKPTGNTKVNVRATAYIPTQKSGLVVLSQTSGQSSDVTSGANIGDEVAIGNLALGTMPIEIALYNPFLIIWEASGDNGTNWALLKVTSNTVYVTAEKPVACTRAALNRPLGTVYTYDSLLAISCAYAAGLDGDNTNRQAVRVKLGAAFALQPDASNPKMKLLYRGKVPLTSSLLTYWLDKTPAQTIADLFTSTTGSVACGTWADMLIIIWALHGMGDGNLVEVRANKGLTNSGTADGFFVRKIKYKKPPTVADDDFTHKFSELVDGGRVPAQNNDDSTIAFENHYIVWDNTNKALYDPSYGGQAIDMDGWVVASVGGITNPTKSGFVTGTTSVSPIDVAANPQSISFKDKTTGATPV